MARFSFNSHRQRFGSLRLLPLWTYVYLFVCVCVCASQKRARARLIRADIFCYCCFLFAKFFTSELHSKLNGAIRSTQACISNPIPLNLKTTYSYQQRGEFNMNSSSLIFVWNNEEINTNDNQKTNTNTLQKNDSNR